jgi:hypothetical protein
MGGAKRSNSKPKVSKRLLANAAPIACRIVVDSSGEFEFQVKAADMPIKIKLCENNQGAPATTSSFNTVQIYNALTNPPKLVTGQPTAVTATGFSLALPAGGYDVVMVLTHLPTSQIAYVYEDCGGLNQLARIPLILQPSGYFSLKVT